MRPVEALSEEALAVLDGGWRRIVSEIGIEFLHPRALEVFRSAGQRVQGEKVYFDPGFLAEQVALAPSTFTLHARNPARDIVLGGEHMVFVPVQGPPYVRRGDVRRVAGIEDFEDFCRIAQALDDFDSAGGLPCEPSDIPVEARHLDSVRALLTLTDKPFQGSQISAVAAADSLGLGELVFGAEKLSRSACMYTNVNANSPLRWDDRMLDALLIYADAGQAVVLTPFLLMGAMSPVSLPATLAQQLAETLTGIALVQTVRPGCPVVMGGFLSPTDMQSGAPSFGGPESMLGVLASGQLARQWNLPWRSGGGALTSSPAVDAQAAYEGMATMTAAFMAGANLVLHTGGWLESGLVASFEKLIVDLDIVRTLRGAFTPLEIDEASLAFDAHLEVGHGGHFFGCAHTMERFRDCFQRPLLATTENYEAWREGGALDANARAGTIWPDIVAGAEPPPLDDEVRAAIDAFVDRRTVELTGRPPAERAARAPVAVEAAPRRVRRRGRRSEAQAVDVAGDAP
jgi:trimethylamine--corrinoid protein Co-methyltransferase